MIEGNSKKRNICIFVYSVRVMNNHAGLAYRNNVFIYKRSINLPLG